MHFSFSAYILQKHSVYHKTLIYIQTLPYFFTSIKALLFVWILQFVTNVIFLSLIMEFSSRHQFCCLLWLREIRRKSDFKEKRFHNWHLSWVIQVEVHIFTVRRFSSVQLKLKGTFQWLFSHHSVDEMASTFQSPLSHHSVAFSNIHFSSFFLRR